MVRNLIVSLSFAGFGLVAYLIVLNVRQAVHSDGWQRRVNIAYAVARTGFVIVLALITEAVFRSPEIPFEWRSALYAIGLTMVTGGYLGIALEQKGARNPLEQRKGRRSGRDPSD